MIKTPSQQGRASRRKGKSGEYFIRDWLTRITGVKWMRTPLSGGFHLSFPWDLMTTQRDAVTAFDGVGIEVKNTAQVSLPAWIEQCQDAEADYGNGFKANKWVIFSKVKGEWYATMPVQQLERFIR